MTQRHHRFSRPKKTPCPLNDRRLKHLLTLHDHNTLSTDFLHELDCPEMSIKTTLLDLDWMHASPNSWLDVPQSQAHYANSLKRPMFYSISEKGQDILLREGLINKKRHRVSFHFPHQAMQDQFLALMKLGAKDYYIPRQAILAEAPEHTQKSRNPLAIETGTVTLIPDLLFGLSDPYRFFLIEIDRGTEQLAYAEKRTRTWEGTVKLYDSFFATRAFQKHFGIYKSPIYLLVITVSDNRMHNMMEYWARYAHTSRHGVAAFQTIPNIGSINDPIKPTAEFFYRPFHRVNHPPLYLNEGATTKAAPTPPGALKRWFTRQT